MTGGTVAVLGKTGRNFAAGHVGRHRLLCTTRTASSPAAAIPPWCRWSAWARPPSRRPASTRLHRDQTDEALLKKLLEDHNRWTGSRRARELLDNWAEARMKFVKVFPNEYKRALAEMYEREVEAASSGNNAHVAMKVRCLRPDRREERTWEKSPASWNTSASRRATSPSPSA